MNIQRFLTFAGIALCAVLFLAIPSPALAQSINFDLGQGPTTTARLMQMTLLVTVLTLAPSILIMVTSFTRIVIVLSFVRSAMGVQSTPPNIVLISLSLFLTFFVMQPVLEKSWEEGVRPLMNNEIDEETSFTRSVEPFRLFMLNNTRQKDLSLFMDMADVNDAKSAKPESKAAKPVVKGNQNAKASEDSASNDVSLRTLIPSFMLSELRRAFEIGFLVYLPFLIIDMVIASLLMSMGMMMLPPTVISLPFKIIFFVLVDGWYLIAGSLVKSYGMG